MAGVYTVKVVIYAECHKKNNQLANVIIFKGATIALLAAVQKPGLFQGLVLSGTLLLPSGGPPSFLRVRFLFNTHTLERIKSDIECK